MALESKESRKIEIEGITRGNLAAYLEKHWKSPEQIISPLSPLRAKSLINNPFSTDSDINLIVARHEAVIVGYLLMIPGMFNCEEKLEKVNYASSLYVHPEYRGLQIAQKLYQFAFNLGLDVIGAEVTPEAASLYRKMGFAEVGPLRHYILDFTDLNPYARLQRSLGKTKLISKILRPMRLLLELLVYKPKKKLFFSRVGSATPNKVSDTSAALKIIGQTITSARAQCRFYRDERVLTWVHSYPWVSDSVKPISPPYHFSEKRDFFRLYLLQFTGNAGQPVCFMVSVSEERGIRRVKLLDNSVADEERRDYILHVLGFAKEVNADRIELLTQDDRAAVESLEKSQRNFQGIGRYLQERQRQYFIFPKKENSLVGKFLNHIALNCCDTDNSMW